MKFGAAVLSQIQQNDPDDHCQSTDVLDKGQPFAQKQERVQRGEGKAVGEDRQGVIMIGMTACCTVDTATPLIVTPRFHST